MPLDEVIAFLAEHHQRATYGAVAEYLGNQLPPIGLMNGRPRNYLNSWIVNADTHEPSGYLPEQIDPHLLELDNPQVITNGDDLERFLSQ